MVFTRFNYSNKEQHSDYWCRDRIASNTQLTIKPAYAGTTGSGKQYAVAPILGYDKDLSDAFNQLRLQYGDQLLNLQPWVDDVTTQFGDAMAQAM